MNIDTKIFNKILPNHIWEHTKQNTHRDQIGFERPRDGSTLKKKSVVVTQHISKMKGNHMIILFDAKKTFEKIKTPSL